MRKMVKEGQPQSRGGVCVGGGGRGWACMKFEEWEDAGTAFHGKMTYFRGEHVGNDAPVGRRRAGFGGTQSFFPWLL